MGFCGLFALFGSVRENNLRNFENFVAIGLVPNLVLLQYVIIGVFRDLIFGFLFNFQILLSLFVFFLSCCNTQIEVKDFLGKTEESETEDICRLGLIC